MQQRSMPVPTTKRSRLRRILLSCALAAPAVAAGSTAHGAGPSDAQRCEYAVERASGKFVQCRLAAESNFTRTTNAAKRSVALARCTTKLTSVFTKAQARYGAACPMTETRGSFDAFLSSCANSTEAAAGGDAFPMLQLYPATGQVDSYLATTNDGVVGADVVPDDGNLERGAGLAFVDNGDGTIIDVNTGLVWEKKDDATVPGLHDKDNTYRWSGDGTQETVWDWLDDVNTEGGTGFAGHSDWRMPNVKELQSIVDYGTSSPAVTVQFNTGCVPGCTITTCSCTVSSLYWSSSTYAPDTTDAWISDFGNGGSGSGDKTDDVYVRAVRAGS